MTSLKAHLREDTCEPCVPAREFNLIACRNLTRHAGSSGSRTHTTELAAARLTALRLSESISPLSHWGRLPDNSLDIQSSRRNLGTIRPGVVGTVLYNHWLVSVLTQRIYDLLKVTGTRSCKWTGISVFELSGSSSSIFLQCCLDAQNV